MTEEVLIKIELEKGENEKKVDALTQKITDLTKANAELKKSNNELVKSGKENSDEYIENTRQLEINKQKINEAVASRKGLIQTILSEDDSIKALKVRNAELIKQRDQLSTSTEAGRNKIAEINKELDKNTATITKNSSAAEKQRFNIGNYKSALDSVIPGLGGFIDGIEGATKAGLKFIATPIGLIIAGLALVLGTIISYLKGTEEGMDKLAEISAQAGAVLNVLIDRVKLLGGALVKFFSGDFAGATDDLTKSFTGLGDEMEREIDLAKTLAQRLDILDDLNLQLKVRLSEQENAIKNLIIQSKNRSLSEEERIKKLTEASELEKRLTGERIALRLAEINAIASEIQMRNSDKEAAQQEGETTLEFAKRILNNNKILLADRTKIADQLVQYNGLLDNQANIQEKIQNQEDAIADKAAAKAEKRKADAEKAAEDAKKKADAAIKERQEQQKAQEDAEREQFKTNSEFLDQKATEDLNRIKESYLNQLLSKEEFEAQFSELEIAALEERKAFLIANQQDTAAIDAVILDKKLKQKDQELAAEKKLADGKKKVREDELKGLNASINAGVALAKEAFGENKAIAIAETVINTVRGMVRAIADYPFPYSAIVAAAVGALGTIQTAKIAGIKFMRGGIAQTGGVLRGQSHAQGGIPFTVAGQPGFEAEGGEAIINKRSTKMFRRELSAINQAGGGASFGRGAIIHAAGAIISGTQTRAAFAQAESRSVIQDVIRSTMAGLPPIVVTVEDINAKQDEVSTINQRAQVI